MDAEEAMRKARASRAGHITRNKASVSYVTRTIADSVKIGNPGQWYFANKVSYEAVRWLYNNGYSLERTKQHLFISWEPHGMEWLLSQPGIKTSKYELERRYIGKNEEDY